MNPRRLIRPVAPSRVIARNSKNSRRELRTRRARSAVRPGTAPASFSSSTDGFSHPRATRAAPEDPAGARPSTHLNLTVSTSQHACDAESLIRHVRILHATSHRATQTLMHGRRRCRISGGRRDPSRRGRGHHGSCCSRGSHVGRLGTERRRRGATGGAADRSGPRQGHPDSGRRNLRDRASGGRHPRRRSRGADKQRATEHRTARGSGRFAAPPVPEPGTADHEDSDPCRAVPHRLGRLRLVEHLHPAGRQSELDGGGEFPAAGTRSRVCGAGQIRQHHGRRGAATVRLGSQGRSGGGPVRHRLRIRIHRGPSRRHRHLAHPHQLCTGRLGAAHAERRWRRRDRSFRPTGRQVLTAARRRGRTSPM